MGLTDFKPSDSNSYLMERASILPGQPRVRHCGEKEHDAIRWRTRVRLSPRKMFQDAPRFPTIGDYYRETTRPAQQGWNGEIYDERVEMWQVEALLWITPDMIFMVLRTPAEVMKKIEVVQEEAQAAGPMGRLKGLVLECLWDEFRGGTRRDSCKWQEVWR